ncbi:ankyrin repeat, SAM and basic leucine zipper domain-containing protein 1 isoform X2 [Heterodontus francisci]|uniref:ankyrin repeat, SAM and basic leucine zipper domain-containing protein 1 isoform X2 n=1 Tax=Heterodontus francisci TaxID=7792 RepID=UPI00355BC1D0
MAAVRCVAAGAELDDSDDGWYLGCDGYDDLNITPVKTYQVKTDSRDDSSVLERSKNDKETGTLKEALASQKAHLVDQILNSGVDVETRFSFGWTPLMYAASVANIEITRHLLDRGANASFAKDQYTVLMAACASSESEEKVVKCVELLLSRNANPNTFGRNRMTPLMYAAREGHTQTTTLLVAQGAEINCQDENGYTALTWASSQGHKSTVLKLIELGADKTLETKHGELAADIAEKKHHSQLASLLTVTSNSSLLGTLQNISKEEAIFKYIINHSNTGKNNRVRSTSHFGDVELFLSGLELEHLQGLFEENDVTFRGLLTMGKEDLEKIKITDPNDQRKILEAVCEMQPEDLQVAQLPSMENFDCSEELTKFLIKLKKHCSHLMATVQNVANQLATNAELRVLDLDPDQKSALVCDDLIKCIQDLDKEVEKLRNLLLKLQNNQERAPSRIPPSQSYFHHYQFLKMVAIGLFGTGFIFFLIKLRVLRN